MATKNNTNEAVRELRLALGDTQQEFANRLGMAISTVVRYELTRAPRGIALEKLAEVAHSIGRNDLAHRFGSALSREFIDAESQLDAGIIRALTENYGRAWLRDQLEKLIADARKGLFLRYPNLFGLQGAGDTEYEPDQSQRLLYLEGLLVNLRLEMEGSALKIIESLAEQLRQQTGKTIEQARTAVMIEHPELYQRYNQERAYAARGTSHEESLSTAGKEQHRKKKGKQ